MLAPLRMTAVLAGWCGLVALCAAGLMSPAFGLVAAAASATVAVNCSMQQSAVARQARKTLSYLALLVAVGFAATEIGSAEDATALASSLPVLLIGVLIAQGLGADKRRDIMVSLTIGEFMLVLAAGVSPTGWIALPLFIGWVLGVVALVQSHQLHRADCSSPVLRADVERGPSALRPAATAIALVVAAGLLLFLLVPQPSGAARSRTLSGRGTSGISGSGSAGKRQRGFSADALDMRTRGKLPGARVADVPSDSPELWRGRIYETYRGSVWTAEEGPVTEIGRGSVALPPDPLDEGAAPTGAQRVDDVRKARAYGFEIISPGTPIAVTSGGRVFRAGAAMLFTEDDSGFVVRSAQPQTDPFVLSGATGSDPDQRWLQLPAALPARIDVLAQEVAGNAPSRIAAVTAISNWLAANKSYDIDSPVPPAGADAVDDFLFRVDTGFCEQFAAAEIIMLRTLGIPARMATGYAYGRDEGNGRRVFTGRNAHAWVEVWYPGIGWSPSDPTPPSIQNPARSGQNVFTRFVKWVQRMLASPRGRLILAVLLVVLVAGCFGVIALVRRRRRRRGSLDDLRESSAGPANTLLAAFGRLERALTIDGRPRAHGETISELERRLGADQGGRRALRTLELALYSPHQVSAQDARGAVHEFEIAASAILAAHAARERLADSIGVRR
ncbi:MAG: transglutaminaseTgpA domain-containing protein [Mycobacteriales bacterium]